MSSPAMPIRRMLIGRCYSPATPVLPMAIYPFGQGSWIWLLTCCTTRQSCREIGKARDSQGFHKLILLKCLPTVNPAAGGSAGNSCLSCLVACNPKTIGRKIEHSTSNIEHRNGSVQRGSLIFRCSMSLRTASYTGSSLFSVGEHVQVRP